MSRGYNEMGISEGVGQVCPGGGYTTGGGYLYPPRTWDLG